MSNLKTEGGDDFALSGIDEKATTWNAFMGTENYNGLKYKASRKGEGAVIDGSKNKDLYDAEAKARGPGSYSARYYDHNGVLMANSHIELDGKTFQTKC